QPNLRGVRPHSDHHRFTVEPRLCNLFHDLTEGLDGEDVWEPGEKMAETAARSPRLRERGKLHLAVSRRQRVGLDLLESERLNQRSAQPGGSRGFGPLI